jgi:hypothetical protein
MLKLFRQPTLLCFSPPVMIATIAIELALAGWVFAKYATSTTKRLIVTLLFCLAAFQLAEFNVCSSAPVDLFWSRFGYIFITALPPLGIHLILKLRHESRPKLLAPSYASGTAFAAAFAFLPTGLNHGVCTGNYVIFLLAQPLTQLYEIYYFVLVMIGLWLALNSIDSEAPASRRRSLSWTVIAYLVFCVPTLIINFIIPTTKVAVPSIMCGFAVGFAIIIGLKVAPLALKKSPIAIPSPTLVR